MKITLAAVSLVLAMTVGLGATEAQVINGESIYEDNFAHAPPKPSEDSPDGRPKQATQGPGSGATQPAPTKPGHPD